MSGLRDIPVPMARADSPAPRPLVRAILPSRCKHSFGYSSAVLGIWCALSCAAVGGATWVWPRPEPENYVVGFESARRVLDPAATAVDLVVTCKPTPRRPLKFLAHRQSGAGPIPPSLPEMLAFSFHAGQEYPVRQTLAWSGPNFTSWTIDYELTRDGENSEDVFQVQIAPPQCSVHLEPPGPAPDVPLVRFGPSPTVMEGVEFAVTLTCAPKPPMPLTVPVKVQRDGSAAELLTASFPLTAESAHVLLTIPDDGLSGPPAPWTVTIQPWEERRSLGKYRLGSDSALRIEPQDATMPPQLTLGELPTSVPENRSPLKVPIALSGRRAVATEISLDLSGTAVAGRHYIAPGRAPIAAGDSSGTVSIPLFDDSRFEFPRTLVIRATSPGLRPTSEKTVIIEDDDPLSGRLLLVVLPTSDLADLAEWLAPELQSLLESKKTDVCLRQVIVPRSGEGLKGWEAGSTLDQLKALAETEARFSDVMEDALRKITQLLAAAKDKPPQVVLVAPWRKDPLGLDSGRHQLRDTAVKKLQELCGVPGARISVFLVGVLGDDESKTLNTAVGREHVLYFNASSGPGELSGNIHAILERPR